MKKWIFSFLLISLLLVGCRSTTTNNQKVIDTEAWPDSKAVAYVPIFSKGEYVSGKCSNTNCEIIFKDVESLSFDEYTATLIKWDYVVNSTNKVIDKEKIYEASNEYFAYVKVTYNTNSKTITINSSIKNLKK